MICAICLEEIKKPLTQTQKMKRLTNGLCSNVKKDSIKKVVAVKTVKKYGLFGIAFLTPIFFSIPLGTFIALRFFPNKKKTLPVLAAAVFGWSFVLSFALTIL